MEQNPILIISAIIAVALLLSWLKVASNVKKIMDKLEGRESVDYCKNEAEIAAFSGNNEDAKKWFYRALFYEAQELNNYATDEAKSNRIAALKDEFLKNIEANGGSWPKSL